MYMPEPRKFLSLYCLWNALLRVFSAVLMLSNHKKINIYYEFRKYCYVYYEYSPVSCCLTTKKCGRICTTRERTTASIQQPTNFTMKKNLNFPFLWQKWMSGMLVLFYILWTVAAFWWWHRFSHCCFVITIYSHLYVINKRASRLIPRKGWLQLRLIHPNSHYARVAYSIVKQDVIHALLTFHKVKFNCVININGWKKQLRTSYIMNLWQVDFYIIYIV